MCGIAGIFEYGPEASASAALLARMTNLIAHRGPDDSGQVIRGGVGLGHRRLSVIDLSADAHQPMGSDDGALWITYNGECYNYRELRSQLDAGGQRFRSHSDTEVLLHLYRCRGEGFVTALDGMFAFALWDERSRTLLVARDRLGIKPLYYYADRDHFIFASEMKALLADPRIPIEVEPAALAHYFQLLSIPDPHCILKGVRKLAPGCYLRVTAGGVEQRRYWDLPVAPDPGTTAHAADDGFLQHFGGAVRSHMVADVPVGAFLSGGVDSSAVVAQASDIAKAPIETFTITFPGLEEFDESCYAAAVARHCGTRHHEFRLTPDLVGSLDRVAWHADEPFAISSALALYCLAGLARERVKVALSGDGGDEVFAGYVWRHADFVGGPPGAAAVAGFLGAVVDALGAAGRLLPPGARRRLDHAAAPGQRYLHAFACFGKSELGTLLQGDVVGPVIDACDDNIVQYHFDHAPGDEQLARKLYTDIKTTLVSEMLTKLDRMTMAHGLEARVPFLDHHLVEWAFTVPGRYKLRDGDGKLLVKRAMEPRLPREILYRRKQGFNVPLKLWLRRELKEFIRDTLAARRLTERGLYRRAALDRLLDDHFGDRADRSNKIFAVLMLELWFQKFVDDRPRHLH
jgi:asparagine synthase (glutamine-hydrolysing)